jgi:hypothetical protein
MSASRDAIVADHEHASTLTLRSSVNQQPFRRSPATLELQEIPHSLDDAVQVLHCARQAFQAGFEGP